MTDSGLIKCGLCHSGKEREKKCGKLYVHKEKTKGAKIMAAHKRCMQYSANLSQFEANFKEFGKFDPKEVKKEIKRGTRLPCTECRREARLPVKGATAGCAWAKCRDTFHFPCAPLRKRIKKAYRDRIEIQYKVYCGKEHLTFDWNKMKKEGLTEEFTFTSSKDTDDDCEDESHESETSQSEDDHRIVTSSSKPKQRKTTRKNKSKITNRKTERTHQSCTRQENSAVERAFSDESDFDMESSQPYPPQTPSKSKTDVEQVQTKRRRETHQRPVRDKGHRSREDSGPDSATDSSLESETPVDSAPREKKKKYTKKKSQTRGTRSPLVPHTKLISKRLDTPVKGGESEVVPKTPRSRSKTLVRPEGQPAITSFLSDRKPARKLNMNEPEKSITPGKYHTVTVGTSEMYLCTADSGARASTSNSLDSRKESNNQGSEYAAEDVNSDIEILEVIPPGSPEEPNEKEHVEQENAARKRIADPSEEPEVKKIKVEPESHDADSTTVIGAAEGEPTSDEEAISDVKDAAFIPDTSGSDVEPSSPVISSVMGGDDYILCITESLITNKEKGHELAMRIREAAGNSVPTGRIVFWRHASDEKYSGQEMKYRLQFMDDLVQDVLKGDTKKLHCDIFLKSSKDVASYVKPFEFFRKYLVANKHFEEVISGKRKEVKDSLQAEDTNWMAQCIQADSVGEEIVMMLHIGDELDPESLVRKKLNYSGNSTNSSDLFLWPKGDQPVNVAESEVTEIIRHFDVSRCEMTDEKTDSLRGGYSVYSSFAESSTDVEYQTVRDWVDEMTNCQFSVFRKPDDGIQRKRGQGFVVNKIKRVLNKKPKSAVSESEDSGSQSFKERAVLLICPVHRNIVNVKEYAKKCVLSFCEEKVTATNGIEVLCLVDVHDTAPSELAQLIHELYLALENYEAKIFTGTDPRKGLATCICLAVSM